MIDRPSLLGVPFDAASSFQRGASLGPAAIRQALYSTAGNLWTEDLTDLGAPEALEDAGDVNCDDPNGVRDRIEAAVASVIDSGHRPIILGGDHSITYPILRGVRRYHPKLTIVHFDAHPDLYDEFQGDRFSHACPMARIMEEQLADRLVQVGIRCMNGHQKEQAERFGVEVIPMKDWREGWLPRVDGPVYLSIDLDVLDPAFAPGLSHPEPGGLSTRQLLTMIQRLDGTIIGSDIVELNPRNDPAGLTARVVAKVVKEVAARTSITT